MSSEIVDMTDLDIFSDNSLEQVKESNEIIDYKMVTFSIGGKDYGIDIMKVKEISKASKFTYVPNSIPFVKGVYNLRGDIISVIDLRIMFNLPVTEKPDSLENMIILRLEDNTIGIIVDSIDKVVGIASEKIQPPHPLFGDINIKFIKGIVENDAKLYIILDVDRIFDQESAEAAIKEKSSPAPMNMPKVEVEPQSTQKGEKPDNVDYSFIVETLATFSRFFVSGVNERWVKERFEKWSEERKASGLGVQLKSAVEADDFLEDFSSPCNGKFWDKEYFEAFIELLPETQSGTFGVWNVGCGKGEETYSLTAALKKRYGNKKIKVYANDNDLLNISTAPNLIFAQNSIPDIYDEYISEGRNGWQFTSGIKDLILFEYHDVTNGNQLPNVDMIVARDVLSFLSPKEQLQLIEIFYEKLNPGGLLITGVNEIIDGNEWDSLSDGLIPAYRKS